MAAKTTDLIAKRRFILQCDIINVKTMCFYCRFACAFTGCGLNLQCVFHGIDLRLTGLVVGRQSIFLY